jgi:hypothetical protein
VDGVAAPSPERGFYLFGYVRPYKPEMKIKDFEAFQSVYCGLCHTLRKRYGPAARMLLSYDATFLALVRLSSGSGCVGIRRKRCPYLLFRRKPCCCGGDEALAFAADASILLFYHKLRDAASDAGFFKRLAARAARPFFLPLYKKAAKRQPEAEALVRAMMEEQAKVESRQSARIDEAAQPTAAMVSKLLELGAPDEAQARVLARMGYFLGRWIYLMDAADDYRKDEKSGDYNVFRLAPQGGPSVPIPDGNLPENESGEEARRRQIAFSLNPCIAEIVKAAELLTYRSHEAVVRNILYLGLPHMQGAVLFKEQGKAGEPAGETGA